MNLTISKRDAKLLLILLGIIILLVAYLAIYNPYSAKTAAVEAETAALQPELADLMGYYENLDSYYAGIDAAAQTVEAELRNYPAAIRSEDVILYAVAMENQTGASIQSISFHAEEIQSQFSVMDKAADGSYSTRELTAWRTGATVSCSLGYQQLKKVIDYVNKSGDRSALENVNVTFDSENGQLTGDIGFNQYFVASADDAYAPTAVSGVTLGRDDLFGTAAPAGETGAAGNVIG